MHMLRLCANNHHLTNNVIEGAQQNEPRKEIWNSVVKTEPEREDLNWLDKLGYSLHILQIANTSYIKPEPDNIVTLNSIFNFRKYQTCTSIMHENGPLPTRPCHIINIQDHVPGVSDVWMDPHTSSFIKVTSSISKTMYKGCQMYGWTHTHPSSFINHFSTFHLG